MTCSRNIFFSMLLLAFLSVMAGMHPKVGLAQDEINDGSNNAYFNILEVNRDDLPVVEVTLAGGAATSDITGEITGEVTNEVTSDGTIGEFIRSTRVEIVEDGIPQTIVDDRMEESTLQLAVLIDPRTLEMQGASGQPRYLEIVGFILKLISRADGATGGLADEQFAALAAEQDGGVGMIQAWTTDPYQLFRSVIKQRSNMTVDKGAPLDKSILSALNMFDIEDSAVRSAKALLFFSAGLDGDDLSEEDLDQLVAQLRAAQVQLYVAQFAAADQPAVVDESLLRLTRDTNGYLMALGKEADLNELFRPIEETRLQRIVTYNSDQLSPNEISVQLALADGNSLTRQVNSRAETIGSEPIVAGAPTVDPSGERIGVDEGAAEDNSTNSISIPGTERSIFRNVLLTALGMLLALLAYFLFSDILTRRAEKKRRSDLISLYENSGQEPYPKHHDYLPSQRGPSAMQKTNALVDPHILDADQRNRAGKGYLDEFLQQETIAPQPTDYELVDEDTIIKRFVLDDSVELDAVKQESSVEEPIAQQSIVQQALAKDPTDQVSPIQELSTQEPTDKESTDEDLSIQQPITKEPINQNIVTQEPIAQKLLAEESIVQETVEPKSTEQQPTKQQPTKQQSTKNNVVKDKPPKQLNQIDSELPTFDTALSKAQSSRTVAPSAMMTNKSYTGSRISNSTQPDDVLRLQKNLDTMPTMGYFVRVTDDPNLPLQLPLYKLEAANDEAKQICIGRNGQVNSIVIHAKRVSREHAVVIQKQGRLYLRDNNSTAGTFLNWHRLQAGEELPIRNNDLIGFGDINYEFRLQNDPKDAGIIQQ